MSFDLSNYYQFFVAACAILTLIYFFLLGRKVYLTRFSRRSILVALDLFIYFSFLLIGLIIYFDLVEPRSGIGSGIIDVATGFIGTILAVSFSFAVIPVQNIANNTTSSIVNRILKNELFIKSLIILVLIFLVIASQKIVGSNFNANIINLFLLVIATSTFIIVIYETLRLLDVRNVIFDYEHEAIGNLNIQGRKISKITSPEKQIQLSMYIKNVLITQTMVLIEPIFVTTKKYIMSDQPEVVAVGVGAIAKIASKYIEVFKYSVQDNDKLLTYLIERFIDLKSVISETSHYSLITNLIQATKFLAINSLEIKTPLSKYHRSYISLGLLSSLKDFVISKELLKETSSAPMEAVLAVEAIGLKAVSLDNFNISNSALDLLVEISIFCTKLNTLYSNEVSKEANRAIMILNYSMLNKFHSYQLINSQLSESLSKPIEAFIEVGIDNPSKGNLSPFIGTSVDPLNMLDPYSSRLFNNLPFIIFYLIKNKEIEDSYVIDYLEEVFTELNQLVMKADDKKMKFLIKEIVDTTYDICFTLMQFINMGYITDKEGVRDLITKRLYYIFHNAFVSSYLKDNNWMDEEFEKWFATIGIFIVTFQTWEGFPKNSVEFLMEKAESTLPSVKILHEGKEFTDYNVLNDLNDLSTFLGLALYWELNLIENIPLRNKILNFLIRNKDLLHQRSSGFSYLPRSIFGLGENWLVPQPFVVYFSNSLQEFRIFLDVYEPQLSRFENYMRKYELTWQLIQLIKFQLKEVYIYEPISHRLRRSMLF